MQTTAIPTLSATDRYLYADFPNGRRIGIPIHGNEAEVREGLSLLAEAVKVDA